MATALVYDDNFIRHDTGRHPERVERYQVIMAALKADRDLWEQLNRLAPLPASDEEIARCHGTRLVDELRSICRSGVRWLDEDTAVCPESFDVARLAAGAAVRAVDQVFESRSQNAFAVVRPPGHHATPNRAMGFCLFNNAAIGARYAQARYGAERVLIIDWDVHHGNGTQDIFYKDPSVFYFSTHQYPYYPGTGRSTETGEGEGVGTTLNVPLGAGTPARVHREAFTAALKQIEREFHPDLIIVSAGFDSRREDPLGGLMLEDVDFQEMTEEVMHLADRHAAGRIVSLLEGGYNLQTLGETVRRHVATLNS
jgi:acetoin utilization deacetylase AcuC-like enzyme